MKSLVSQNIFCCKSLLEKAIHCSSIQIYIAASLSTQVGMLLKRELLNIVRNKRVLAARFMLTFFMSFLLGIIFYDVGSKPLDKFVNIQSHFGGLVMVLMLGMFG
jgi:hypothetical protein